MHRRSVTAAIVAMVGILALTASCSGGGSSPPTDDQAEAAVEAAVLDEDDPGDGDWEEIDPDDEAGGNLTFLRSCGALTELVDDAADGVLEQGETVELEGEVESGDGTLALLRVVGGAAVYEDEAAAQVAFDAVVDDGEEAFEECMEEAITDYVGDVDEEETDGNPGDLDLLDVEQGEEDDLGDGAVFVVASYPEEILGGYDNENALVALVARTGPALVTVAVSAGQQSLDSGDLEDLAVDLAEELIERVDEELS